MRISDWSSDVCSSDLSKVSPRKSSNSLEDAGPRAYIEGGGYCPARAFAKIPEAIHHPRGLSLPGPWSDAHGPHLTLLASEDLPANDLGGPANRPAAVPEEAQRRPRGGDDRLVRR